jgi:hypothetical protein
VTHAQAAAALHAGVDGREIVGRMVAEGGWTEASASEYLQLLRDGGDVIDECVECGEPIGADGRWYSDGLEFVPYCAECAKREFG